MVDVVEAEHPSFTHRFWGIALLILTTRDEQPIWENSWSGIRLFARGIRRDSIRHFVDDEFIAR